MEPPALADAAPTAKREVNKAICGGVLSGRGFTNESCVEWVACSLCMA